MAKTLEEKVEALERKLNDVCFIVGDTAAKIKEHLEGQVKANSVLEEAVQTLQEAFKTMQEEMVEIKKRIPAQQAVGSGGLIS